MWFKDDIRNILAGIELSSGQTAAFCSDDCSEAFRTGFRAAIVATAASFGVLLDDADKNQIEILRQNSTLAIRVHCTQNDCVESSGVIKTPSVVGQI